MKKALIAVVCTCLASLVDAGIFLKEKDPLILQGAIWLYSNASAITQVAMDVPANRFIQTVAPLDNLPSPGIDGATGVLYNRDDSCSPLTVQQPIPLPFYDADPKSSKVPKIALIKKQGGNCTLVQKILNAEYEGAIGAIVYDTLTNATHFEDRKAGVPPESGITIPAYYADHSVGLELYHQLEKMAGVPIHKMPVNDNSNLTTKITVRVSLMPADNIKPVAWEYTLLVMIVILGTSILFSVLMHIYMWKKNQRLHSVVERQRAPNNTEGLPMGKALLTVARLYEFPTRTIDSLPDEEERKKVETVLSDEKQREALMSTTAVSSAAMATTAKNERSFFGGKRKKLLRKPSLASVIIKIDAPVNNMCVVCLEAFKIGDEVRELPCHHEYHCICIDPWLTSKSGECPLCKFDCSADSKSETVIDDPDGLIAASKVTGLRGVLLRPYLRFKANRRKRMGQVGDLPTTSTAAREGQAQPSRQSTMITSTEAPSSPGLRAALRAVEASESAALQQQQQQEQQERPLSPAMEAQQMAYAAATTGGGENNDPHASAGSMMDEPLTPLHPHERALAEQLPRASTDSRHTTHTVTLEEEETLPRPSMATQDYAPTIGTSASTYVPAADGGLLPDIDVSSISLCSIDLDNIANEDEHHPH
ncbi:hypothetical protein V8B55DRAFT_1519092 [Mucor lusitanicus]|uniref:RING-type domain-containing protein n=1 Tax=Mucor circinelloides f. lusitanicus TaxID=29924 RepID=A0A8H4BBE3_MUCCL|nr:hypothetical protein FB192DRAFT_1160719 [Mucor lusitanicus]